MLYDNHEIPVASIVDYGLAECLCSMSFSSSRDQWASLFLMRHKSVTQNTPGLLHLGWIWHSITPTHIALAVASHMAEPRDKGGAAKWPVRGHGSKKGVESFSVK